MLRPWDFNIDLKIASGSALYLQLAKKITKEIEGGRLSPNTVMPGTRELANQLNLNRKTVVLCYEELISQGWLTTQMRRGTFVSSTPPVMKKLSSAKLLIDETQVTRHYDDSGFIDFTDESPCTTLEPNESLTKSLRKALANGYKSKLADAYTHLGSVELRNQIANMLNHEAGMNVNMDNVCIVSSSQMATFISARVLSKRKGVVIFEQLHNLSCKNAFTSCGINVDMVDIDENGISIEGIERIAAKDKINAVYVTPQHQYPTAACLSDARRNALVQLSNKHDFLILENDQSYQFNLSGRAVFPLASHEQSDNVVYIGDLNRVLRQGLRIGFMVGSKAYIHSCEMELALNGCQVESPIQEVIANLLIDDEIQRCKRKLTKHYMEKRDFVINLIEEHLMKWVSFEVPLGGLGLWIRCNANIDQSKLTLCLEQEKVRIFTSKDFGDDTHDKMGLRLSFANIQDCTQGILKLKSAFANAEYSL